MLRRTNKLDARTILPVSDPIYFDITGTIDDPILTGIQRVQLKIIQYWPGPRPLVPCHYSLEHGAFCRLPSEIFATLTSDEIEPGEPKRHAIAAKLGKSKPLSQEELMRGLFNAEVFYDPHRANAYRALCAADRPQVSWLVYDFLPFLRPIDYPIGCARLCMHYLLALGAVPRVSFISRQTQSEYMDRVIRKGGSAGPFFPLGGDGLNLEKQSFNPTKNSFVYVGTIEPRKNVANILEAFQLLWSKGIDAKLVVAGRLEARSLRERDLLDTLKGESRFRYLGHVNDEKVREILREARALIYVSAAEGFGLPPWESLAAGIPVITRRGTPSLDHLPPGGRIELDEITRYTVAEGVEQLLNDATARLLWSEASALSIPTWREFVTAIATWVDMAGVTADKAN